jgi:hypothetical protein
VNQLITLKTHTEPADYRGPFDPVQAAIRHTGRSTPCHRCEDATIPDLVHLADADDQPLCPTCARLLCVALRRGLLALNQLENALRHPQAHPAATLVWDWRAALEIARPEEKRLLQIAAQLLAEHIGYQPPGFTAAEIAE